MLRTDRRDAADPSLTFKPGRALVMKSFPCPTVVIEDTHVTKLRVYGSPPPAVVRAGNFCVWVSLIVLTASLCFAVDPPSGLTIKGPVPWIDVMAYGAKGDGTTDDRAAIQSAIDTCPTTGNLGCTVFFPIGTYRIGSASSGTAGLTVGKNTATQGVNLVGQCSPIGSTCQSCTKLVSGQSGTGGVIIVDVGDGTNAYEGFKISNIEFNDGSLTGILGGALRLNIAVHFVVENVFCKNFRGGGTGGIGFCLAPSSGSSVLATTQYGTVTGLNTSNTKYPVQTTNRTSSINFYGGDIQCGLATPGSGSIGMDLGVTNSNGVSGEDNGGEWGVFGTHILNCDTGIGLVSVAGFQDYAVLEQTGSYKNDSHGQGITISTISGTVLHTGGTILAGSLSEFHKGIVLNANVEPVTVLSAFNNTQAGESPFYSNGDAMAEKLALFLGVVNPLLMTPLGMQIPTDLTLVGTTTAPSPSLSGNGREYFDSTANVFKASRNAGSYGFTAFVPSGGIPAGNLVKGGVSATGDLADSTFTVVASGSAGTGPTNQGSSSALARSDHDHRSIQTLTWFFPQGQVTTTGAKTQTLALPDQISNISVIDFRVVADSTSTNATAYNIQQCAAPCTSPSFANIYSTSLSLPANARSAHKNAAPDSITSFGAGDQFKLNVTTANAAIMNFTATLTYKCNTSN